MKNCIILFVKNLSMLICLFLPVSLLAEPSAAVTGPNEATVSDNGLGVEIKVDKDGNLLSVRSKYTHPVEFPDARGKSKAYIIAEEKAKANVARFMSQVSSSTRLATEIDESVSESSRKLSNSGENWSKDNVRKVTESLKEITGSSATAVLRGVKILRQSYDPKAEEVTVEIGINKDTQRAAAQLSQGLDANDGTDDKRTNAGSFPGTLPEDKKSKDYDKF